MHLVRYVSFKGAGISLTLKETEIPVLQTEKILVRKQARALCRSDLSTYTGKREEKTPTILGHEVTGKILALNGMELLDLNEERLFQGDQITRAIYPQSEATLRGMPQKSVGLFKYSHEIISVQSLFHEGLAKVTILRKYTPVIKLPKALPASCAAIINCSVSPIAGALRLSGSVQARRVTVYGASVLGIIACLMAKESGAASMTVIDTDTQRLKIASEFGADEAIPSSLPSTIQPDITLETTGVAEGMEQSIATLATESISVWVGGVHPQPPVLLNAEAFIRNLYTLHGLHNYTEKDLQTATAFMLRVAKCYPF